MSERMRSEIFTARPLSCPNTRKRPHSIGTTEVLGRRKCSNHNTTKRPRSRAGQNASSQLLRGRASAPLRATDRPIPSTTWKGQKKKSQIERSNTLRKRVRPEDFKGPTKKPRHIGNRLSAAKAQSLRGPEKKRARCLFNSMWGRGEGAGRRKRNTRGQTRSTLPCRAVA